MRFKLRTLFLAVAIFGLLLGWQVKLVRDRMAAFHQLEANGAKALGRGEAIDTPGHHPKVVRNPGAPLYGPPWYRCMLGDRAVRLIYFPRAPTSADMDLATTFPEAIVIALTFPHAN